MTISIDKNIPVPTLIRRGRHASLPSADLEIGDSFMLPAITKDELDQARTRLRSSTASLIKKGRKFATRSVEGGIRIWRTA